MRASNHPASPPATHLGWRVLAFLLITVVIVAAEQIVEVWLLPGPSAELAVRQLEASETAAESLRLFETLRGFLPVVSGVLVLLTAIVVLVPGVGRRVYQFIKAPWEEEASGKVESI